MAPKPWGAFLPSSCSPMPAKAIDNLVLRGSFPPLMLSPVHFDAALLCSSGTAAAPKSRAGKTPEIGPARHS